MERGVEIVYLRLANVVGVHGLDQVSPAEVEQTGIIGLGQAFFKRDQFHGPEREIRLNGLPDMGDEHLVITEPASQTATGGGLYM